MAMARTGVTRDTPDPPGAAIGRDDAGEPNGMFYESAVALARGAVDEPPENALTAMQRGLGALARWASWASTTARGLMPIAAFRALDADEHSPARGHSAGILPPRGEHCTGPATGFGSDRLRRAGQDIQRRLAWRRRPRKCSRPSRASPDNAA